jgi:two-component system KDP operon response regulator KdpE
MSATKTNILIIEDDPPLRRFLRATLESQDYRVTEATNGRDGVRLAASTPPDLVILDLGLPDMDGLDVIKRLREWFAIPIIVVSARGQERDKVLALDGGANDYLTKPFGVGELLARVRVGMRSVATADHQTGETAFSTGGLRVDLARREIAVDGQAVHLTPNEFRLLTALVKHRGKVLTHKQLLTEVWGPDSTEESHYLRVYMNQLRQKLEADPSRPVYLLTEAGVGYRLACDD